MLTRVALIGLMAASLSACVTQTELLASPVDWDQLNTELDVLATPTAIAGPHQHRSDVETNGQLWRFSLRAEQATDMANGDKVRMAAHVRAVSEAATKPPCRWRWKLLCRD